jgi:hypothetical protein
MSTLDRRDNPERRIRVRRHTNTANRKTQQFQQLPEAVVVTRVLAGESPPVPALLIAATWPHTRATCQNKAERNTNEFDQP